jgi:hypothetical protein
MSACFIWRIWIRSSTGGLYESYQAKFGSYLSNTILPLHDAHTELHKRKFSSHKNEHDIKIQTSVISIPFQTVFHTNI